MKISKGKKELEYGTFSYNVYKLTYSEYLLLTKQNILSPSANLWPSQSDRAYCHLPTTQDASLPAPGKW